MLSGHVLIGPICPVERIGNPCKPSPEVYTSRQVMVYKVGSKTVIDQNIWTRLEILVLV